MIRKVNPLAASGERATRPSAADSQETARTNASSTPTAASHPPGPAWGRKPRASPAASTSAPEVRWRATLAATWPAITDRARTSIERRRSTNPPPTSWQTATAVSPELKPAHFPAVHALLAAGVFDQADPPEKE